MSYSNTIEIIYSYRGRKYETLTRNYEYLRWKSQRTASIWYLDARASKISEEISEAKGRVGCTRESALTPEQINFSPIQECKLRFPSQTFVSNSPPPPYILRSRWRSSFRFWKALRYPRWPPWGRCMWLRRTLYPKCGECWKKVTPLFLFLSSHSDNILSVPVCRNTKTVGVVDVVEIVESVMRHVQILDKDDSTAISTLSLDCFPSDLTAGSFIWSPCSRWIFQVQFQWNMFLSSRHPPYLARWPPCLSVGLAKPK